MPNFISEEDIERALVRRLVTEHGFQALDANTEDRADLDDGTGRSDKREVVLAARLRAALVRLNPELPAAAIDMAVSELIRSRNAMSVIAANQEVHRLIRDGVPVEFQNGEGRTEPARVRVIDFDDVGANDLLAVTQLWIAPGGLGRSYRRPDVLLYVNGLPLVFVELKNSNVKLRSAFDGNVGDYRRDIPQLFVYNAFLLLSNAVDTRVGSITAEWEHFFHWLRPEDEREKIDRKQIAETATSLERAITGLLAPPRLLDYVENFILFYADTQKVIAQNHQFIGVNRALLRFGEGCSDGKLGVFWHTQGSGKSYSMIFYTRKIQRKLGGHYSFVVVTDRDDLDGQIYRNFLNTGAVTEQDAARPKNGEKLREALGQHKRIVFTLIQKFRYERGRTYPLLSARDDIVVIVDEAHRTQYKSLAENMRAGLPNAAFLAFTGTPLLGRERRTHAWFGAYVSEYNFRQSMDDGATVPLFYEKRVPEVLIQNDALAEEFYELLDSEDLDAAQQAKLEREFARETEVIKRDDRLDTIARDIVYHFPRRGYLGKGLVVAVDKFTAVKMYDKVQALWKAEIKRLIGEIGKTTDELERLRMQTALAFMRGTEMAVVVSEEAGEDKKFEAQALNVAPHRKRMNAVDAEGHDIEYNFKDPTHPLQLVFVCAMWLTGFDAPTLSTLYLDKPQKNHTLMQTIARANRVTSHLIDGKSKISGEVIDYYNVFRNMKRALADYAESDDKEVPVREKAALFDLLDDALAQGAAFCAEKGIELTALLQGSGTFRSLGTFNGFADTLLSNEDWRRSFNVYENTISALYEACKPEILSEKARPLVYVFQYLRGVIDGKLDEPDVDALRIKIGQLLDQSVVATGGNLQEPKSPRYEVVVRGRQWDLRNIDLDKLRAEFKQTPYKNIEIESLRAFIASKLEELLDRNVGRVQFTQRFQQIIDRYNAGGTTNEQFFEELSRFAADLGSEDERHVREGLSEKELEVFDVLKQEKMTKAEEQMVKLAAKDLLHRLLEQQPKVLIAGWYKDVQSQRRVRSVVEEMLDLKLPDSYDRMRFKLACDSLFDLIVNRAVNDPHWNASVRGE